MSPRRDNPAGMIDGVPLGIYSDWLPQVTLLGVRNTGRTNGSHLMDDDLNIDYEDLYEGMDDECPYD